MKYIALLFLTLTTSFTGIAQETNELSLESNFNAIIVKNMKVSLDWYTSVLGFQVIRELSLEERGIKIANLKNGKLQLELIEAINSIDPSKDKLDNALMQGLFKFGFSVSEFDKWIYRLTDLNATFSGSVVVDPVSGKKMIIVLDPDGNRIQIFDN